VNSGVDEVPIRGEASVVDSSAGSLQVDRRELAKPVTFGLRQVDCVDFGAERRGSRRSPRLTRMRFLRR